MTGQQLRLWWPLEVDTVVDWNKARTRSSEVRMLGRTVVADTVAGILPKGSTDIAFVAVPVAFALRTLVGHLEFGRTGRLPGIFCPASR